MVTQGNNREREREREKLSIRKNDNNKRKNGWNRRLSFLAFGYFPAVGRAAGINGRSAEAKPSQAKATSHSYNITYCTVLYCTV